MYAPNTGPFLLLCATVPPLVAMVSMIVIRPIEAPKRKDDTDKSKFSTLYVSRDSGLHMVSFCTTCLQNEPRHIYYKCSYMQTVI
jgi:hypothetical protein